MPRLATKRFPSGVFPHGILLIGLVFFMQDAANPCLYGEEPPSALGVIESSRGGRHWVDEETAPPRSPAQSLAAIEIEPGYSISLFASEPLVFDPVAICFDADGRMYAAEYGDYPTGPADGGKALSRISILEDTDGDQIADRRTVFADELDFAHSMMPYYGGLLVGAKTKILYLKDTDGDRVADQRTTLFDGFKPAHPQMQIGNPRWGIDNWVYLNYGPGKITAGQRDNANPVELPRKDFRFDPLTMRFEPDSGMGQFGNTIDRWGRRFYCTNRNPIITTFLSPAVSQRNPFHVVSSASYDVAPSGGDAKVFPTVAMKSNYLSHAGTHTSACGTTAYLGELGDPAYRNSVFVCEPIGHLVTRSIIEREGLRLNAKRARPKADFITSADTWFRPSSLATGPDGALYLADMYRLWVEHPKFLPPEVAAKLQWRAGEDRGRIYRIVPKGAQTKPYRPPSGPDDYASLLEEANGWKQFLGQRLLVESQLSQYVPQLQHLLTSRSATTRLHALWTLEGLGSLQNQQLGQALADKNRHVRRAAVVLSQGRLDDDEILRRVTALATDDDVTIRFQVALSLSDSSSAIATETLVDLALSDGHDPHFADGMLTSLETRSGKVLERIVHAPSLRVSPPSGRSNLVRRLGTVVAARGELDELSGMLQLLEEPDNPWRDDLVAALGEGLPRYRGKLGRLSLGGLLENPPPALSTAAASLKPYFDRLSDVANDPQERISRRVLAINLLGFRNTSQTLQALHAILASLPPAAVQSACIGALHQQTTAKSIELGSRLILEHWSSFGPEPRSAAIGWLMRRSASVTQLLEAIERGDLRSSALSIDQRVRLLKHSDEAIKEQATRLFGGAVSSNRLEVAKQYESCLSMESDQQRGEKVFQRVCANCHRIRGQGKPLGPDLTDVKNRSKAALLYDILDPNSKVEPQFNAYSIMTTQGVVYSGLIDSETEEAIVLKMAEGKIKTIGRAEVELLKASDVSMMPEGVEKDITPQQMADLLAYLKEQ